jgi:GTP-binding protein Era
MLAGQSHAASPGELAVELVREKLYRRLNQEIPYRLTVTLEAAGPDMSPGGAAAAGGRGLCIRVGVGVSSKLVKAIVVGKGGEVIQKYVAEPTQAELTRILKQPVKLVVGVRIVS